MAVSTFTDEQVKDMSKAQKASLNIKKSGSTNEYQTSSSSAGKFGGVAKDTTKGKADTPTEVGAVSSFDGQKYLTQLQGIQNQLSGFEQQMLDRQGDPAGTNASFLDQDQSTRGGRGTVDSPLTEVQIDDLERQGITPGDEVPGKGPLSPLGTVPQASVTVIDPETEATQTFEGDPDTVAQQVADAEANGMQVAESSETGITATEDPEITRLTQERDDAISEVESLQRDLSDLVITDEELRGQIRSINKTWNSRKDEMRDITKRQIGKINTMGMRNNMRYTGGGGGVWGALISESERQGVLAIADLDGQQQSKVMEAKAAAREFNYAIYSDLIDDAQALQREKSNELAKLKEAQQEKEEELAQKKRTVEVESRVSQLVLGDEEAGIDSITDPNLIYQMLNVGADGKVTGDYTMDEITAAMMVQEPDDVFKDFPADLAYFEWLKSIDDPSVRGMTPFQYLQAVGNARRGPVTAGGGGKTTVEERKMNAISELSSYMSVNAVFPGTNQPIVGQDDGYIGADGWRYLSEQVAPELGVNREEFLSNFANRINPDHINNEDLSKYNLTPVDIQQVMGYSAGQVTYKE